MPERNVHISVLLRPAVSLTEGSRWKGKCLRLMGYPTLISDLLNYSCLLHKGIVPSPADSLKPGRKHFSRAVWIIKFCSNSALLNKITLEVALVLESLCWLEFVVQYI